MPRKLLFIIYIACITIFLPSCQNNGRLECSEIYRLNGLKNGDAKFYDGSIVCTNVDNAFTLIDYKNDIKTTLRDVRVNWFSVEKTDKIIVYSSFDRQIGILKLDDKLNVKENNVVISSKLLPIDPSITKIGDKYYITVTYIDGAVNNSDKDKENGLYTVAMYSTEDLLNWEHLGNIIEDRHNLEDVITCFENGRLYVFYEREEYDKGSSSLEGIYSDDRGISWSEPKVFRKADADNELGNIEPDNGRFTVYYSSDAENKGMSYDGGEIYVQHMDYELNALDAPKKYEGCEGALLYDTKTEDDTTQFLCAEKYITEGNFVVYKED